LDYLIDSALDVPVQLSLNELQQFFHEWKAVVLINICACRLHHLSGNRNSKNSGCINGRLTLTDNLFLSFVQNASLMELCDSAEHHLHSIAVDLRKLELEEKQLR
jgi:hypothetical protein